jgi:DNA topoisomerase I
MSKKLVIVESPAKAKTISRFLGPEYVVEASYGHVRDLPEKRTEIPEELRKKKWAQLGVNVEENFEPIYVVPEDKAKYVSELKRKAKGVKTLLLATDEDREGESISWHVLELLAPPRGTEIKRIVFHEITPEAIEEALKHPRDLDERLVKAQETRRVLDRLFGYTLSPLLWRVVAPGLSAGRVQSVAVRLLVERERARMRFVSAEYAGVKAQLQCCGGQFEAGLSRIDEARVATSKSFDPDTGQLKDPKQVLLSPNEAQRLEPILKEARPWRVSDVESHPETERPAPPFMTSTLQQEASRKLKFPARKTMQIAQQLYEGIEMGGEREGLITYMRTDSLTLADRALKEAREFIQHRYGSEYLPKSPRQYKTKSKSAQEAHEAIRPTVLARTPEQVRQFLNDDQFKLYELIWKRTIASQMEDARLERTNVAVQVAIEGKTLTFTASGKKVLFPGFFKVYVEGTDDPEADSADGESILPDIKANEEVEPLQVTATKHNTKPPLRYTEATLVRKLEEEGIGRPSTYASIIGTIQDRGYVFKRGNELIPTFHAFSVVDVLENHFTELVDLKFTANMERQLDEIAEGRHDHLAYLSEFYRGTNGHKGLEKQVEEERTRIPYPRIELGTDSESNEPVTVRVGRFGAFIQRGEGGPGDRATIPPDTPPADLTLDKAIEFLKGAAAGPEVVGFDNASGRQVFYRKGRFGDYLELEQTEEEKEAGATPKRVTLPSGLKVEDLTDEVVEGLVQLPRAVGQHPETGEDIVAAIGKFGPYIKSGEESRSLEDWRQAVSIGVDEAVEVLKQPKGGRGTSAKPAALKEFGQLEGVAGPVKVMSGRYGPYVTDGKTNATLPKGMDPESVTPQQAVEMIQAKAAAGPSKRPFRRGRKKSA